MKQGLILFLFLTSFSIVRGQINDPKIEFGVKAGVNVSNMNFNKGFPKPSEPSDASWKIGFLAGITMQVPVYGKLSVQPEYLYLKVEGEKKSIQSTYSFDYLSLPVLFKHPVVPRFSLLLGPQFDLLINAERNGGTKITHDTEERSISAVAGIEFAIANALRLNARYLHGINHIGIGQRSEVTEFKFEGAQLSASYIF